MRCCEKIKRGILIPGGMLVILFSAQTVSAGDVYLSRQGRAGKRYNEYRDSERSRRQHRSAGRFGWKEHGPVRSHPNVHGSGFIQRLPFRAEKVYFNGILFYYYNGLYYRPHNYGYIRVIAPVGICVNHLPAGYHIMNHRDGPAFEHNGNLYVKYHGKYKVISSSGHFVRTRH